MTGATMLYEELVRDFRWDVPERFNFATDVVDVWAVDRGRVALYGAEVAGDPVRWTFHDVAERGRRFAQALRGRGIGRGDVVLVGSPPRPETMAAIVGTLRLGAIVATAPARLSIGEIGRRAAESAARVVVAMPSDALREACGSAASSPLFVSIASRMSGWLAIEDLGAEGTGAASVSAEDPAFRFYDSSGASVVHGQRFGLAARAAAEYWADLRRTDLHWSTFDPLSARGMAGLLGAWALGVPFLLADDRGDPDRRAAILEQSAPTTMTAHPRDYRELLDLGRIPKRLRHCTATGATVDEGTSGRWREATGLVIHEGYGRTAAPLLIANVRGLPVRPGSMGKPLPGHDVVVVDAAGNESSPGTVGEIAVRGVPPTLDLSRRGDTLHPTGDLAHRDEQGYFWFRSR